MVKRSPQDSGETRAPQESEPDKPEPNKIQGICENPLSPMLNLTLQDLSTAAFQDAERGKTGLARDSHHNTGETFRRIIDRTQGR